jgi:putative ABC transport system permease protein
MRPDDLLALSLEALSAHRLRYALSALAIAVGIGAVVLLVSIGEGTRRFVVQQMSQFGTTVVGVNPGKVSTGGIPGAAGSSRHLTLDDAMALRRVPGVTAVMPYAMGTAAVEGGGRIRSVVVQGVVSETERVWTIHTAVGQFLPKTDWSQRSPVCVLGPKLKRELFGDGNVIGERVRVADARYRVIGVMESKGNYLGFDLDDTAYLPVADVMALFRLPEVLEIDMLCTSVDDIDSVVARTRALMINRHRREDVTITSQKDAMQMVNNILRVLTGSVAAIAAISLLVGSIGILTILWIVVRERTREIGLVRALGGTRAQIVAWYLCEAALTAAAGGIAGLALGVGGGALLHAALPALQSATPPGIVITALALSVTVGLVAGAAPAWRASRLDPVESLRAE